MDSLARLYPFAICQEGKQSQDRETMSPDEFTSQTLTAHYLTVCIPVLQKGLAVGNGITHWSHSIAWEADCECHSTGDGIIR